MPVNEMIIEDFQRIWSELDKEATGFITIEQLDKLIIEIAKSGKHEAAKLVGKNRLKIRNEAIKVEKGLADEEFKQKAASFRNRLIRNAEIPTFDNMKRVMFYDVLIKLGSIQTREYVLKDYLLEQTRKLSVLAALPKSEVGDMGSQVKGIVQPESKHGTTYDK